MSNMPKLYAAGTFHERKKQRTEYYEQNVKGWKKVACSACAGTGVYDHNGSPSCGWCGGTGTDWEKPQQNPVTE